MVLLTPLLTLSNRCRRRVIKNLQYNSNTMSNTSSEKNIDIEKIKIKLIPKDNGDMFQRIPRANSISPN